MVDIDLFDESGSGTTPGLNMGVATVSAYTVTRVVNHGLAGIPTVILESSSLGGALNFVTNENLVDFTINIDAPQDNDIIIKWIAMI